MLDDLHWAGEETLALLASLVVDPAPGAVLLIGTYRTTDVPGRLADFLGRAARAEPTRVYLGGLPSEAHRPACERYHRPMMSTPPRRG